MKQDKRQAFFYNLRRGIRILAESVPSFLAAEGVLRAASLTYYTIFSVVPIFALLFGVAKGFGLDEWFKTEMLARFQAHDEILKWLCNFANTTLHEARGGVVAGIGALLLCWTVIKMIGNIEKAFNRVWHVARARSIFRKFTDYIPVLIIAPVLVLAAGSASVLVSSRLKALVASYDAFSSVSLPVIEFGVVCTPYFLTWVLYVFLYLFLPNTRVRWGSALFGGFIAGTLAQLLQNGYIFVQMALSRYNVIYGSFSALPLFLIWVNLNWLIVLYGVNLSWLWQNFDWDSVRNNDASLSPAERRILALKMAAETAQRFENGARPPERGALAAKFRISRTLVNELLEALTERHILMAVSGEEYDDLAYVPAIPLDKLTVAEFLTRWDDLTAAPATLGDAPETPQSVLGALNKSMQNAPENCRLTELFKRP